MQQGDNTARETFIKCNLRLVLSVIQRFNNRGENVDDLFQVGCIGLMKAIDNFDLNQNVRFSTYAVPMIIGEIRRYLRDNNAIRVSRSLRDIAYKALQAKEKILSTTNKEATIEEKNEAYEQIQYLTTMQGKEEAIETKLKNVYKVDNFVSIDNSTVNVVVAKKEHDVNLANNIMKTVQEEFENKMYITVKFAN